MTDGGGGGPRDDPDRDRPRQPGPSDPDADGSPSADADRDPGAASPGPRAPPGEGASREGEAPGTGPAAGGTRGDAPPHADPRDGAADVPSPTRRPLLWYVRSRHPLVVASRDVLTSVLLVAMVGLALFAASGVWPPLVAIESGSMEPNMHKGDLVLVVESDRYTSQAATEHGIVTRAIGEEIGHSQFGNPGSVIVFRPDGGDGTPIIHRAVYYAEAGENWAAAVDPRYLQGRDCTDLDTCPAEYAGYITRGDANARYDQAGDQSDVVRPEWIQGRAVGRLPVLGCLRLELSGGAGCWDEGRRSAVAG